MYVDTYIISSNEGGIKRFCDAFSNVIGPRAGTAAVAQQVLDDGSIISPQAARGDPLQYYACIRATSPLTLPESITVCSETEGVAVLGTWA